MRLMAIAAALGLALAAGAWIYWIYQRRRIEGNNFSTAADVESELPLHRALERNPGAGVEQERAAVPGYRHGYLIPRPRSSCTKRSMRAPASATRARALWELVRNQPSPQRRFRVLRAYGENRHTRTLDIETTAILALPGDPNDDTAAREFAFFNPESTNNTHVMMAGGLDEAPREFVERRKNPAEVLRQALEREPERSDLRLKLLELYYTAAAQNRRAFLEVARQLAKNEKLASTNDWSQITDMGRSIAPDDELFSNGPDKKAVA